MIPLFRFVTVLISEFFEKSLGKMNGIFTSGTRAFFVVDCCALFVCLNTDWCLFFVVVVDQAALDGRQVGLEGERRGGESDFAAACSESTVKIFDIYT